MSISTVEFPQLIGASYRYPSWGIDCQESINFEPIPVNSNYASTKTMMIGTAGLEHLKFSLNGVTYDEIPCDVEGGVVRGIYRCSTGFGGYTSPATIVVCGESVYEICEKENDVYPLKKINGSISNLVGFVSIAECGNESGSDFPPSIAIADGTNLYIVNMDTYEMETIGTDCPLFPKYVTFLDERIYACGSSIADPTLGKPDDHVYWCSPNNPKKWNPLDYVAAATTLDTIKRVIAVGGQLWMIGEETTEIWRTSGSSGSFDTPISRVSSRTDGIGAINGDSVAVFRDSVFFVGGGRNGYGQAFMGNGSEIKSISTDAMNQEWAKYNNLEDAVSWTYSEEGRDYWVVTFRTANVTWVYNINADMWHKRSSRTLGDVWYYWKANMCVRSFGMNIVAELNGKKLYRMALDIHTEDGNPIVRMRRCPHISKGNKLLRHASLTIDLECGHYSLESGQGSDPQIMLRAYDGGGRIPREERWKSAGLLGQYDRRVKWMRLGSARDRVYEIKVSDPIKWVFRGARIEVEDSIGGL